MGESLKLVVHLTYPNGLKTVEEFDIKEDEYDRVCMMNQVELYEWILRRVRYDTGEVARLG